MLGLLLADADAKVVQAALDNPRLREPDLRLALRAVPASRTLIEQAAASSRWRECYGVRLELVLQPQTPLAIALAQISSLVPHDLRRVAGAPGLGRSSRRRLCAWRMRAANLSPEPQAFDTPGALPLESRFRGLGLSINDASVRSASQ